MLQDGMYYHSWKRNDESGHTSKHLVLSMAAAKEFIELCDSGDASKNKGELLAMLLQLEHQAHAPDPKVHTKYLSFVGCCFMFIFPRRLLVQKSMRLATHFKWPSTTYKTWSAS